MLDSFDGLLEAARQQPEGQRFLLIFARVTLPDGSNPAQIERFHAGQGGALEPAMYVDKSPSEIRDFRSLVAEAENTSQTLGQDSQPGNWDILVVGALAGFGAREPSSEEAEQPLNDLLRTIRTGGSLTHLAGFDREGHPVAFQ